MSAHVQFHGFEKLSDEIKKLDFSDQRDFLADAAIEAVEPIRADMSARAPVDSGFLSEHIVAQVDKKYTDIRGVAVDVAPVGKAFYAGFQEYGTAHHPPQPFGQPALEANIDRAQDNFIKIIDRKLSK